MWVHLRGKRRWEAKERWRRHSEETGGCIKQQVADALWELSECGVDVGTWYRRVEERRGIRYETYVYCGVVVNGVELDQPQCRAADECVKQILEEYKREVERLKEPPPHRRPTQLRSSFGSGRSCKPSALIGLGSGLSLGIGWLKSQGLCVNSRGWLM
jgi:hypothetical protein